MSELDNSREIDRNPQGQPSDESPKATTVLVLGILGLVVCGICGIIALIMGQSEFKQGYPRKGNLYAGWILGLIGTILTGIFLVIIIIYFIFLAIIIYTIHS